MDRLERPLVNLPLLRDPSSYVPDTVDLTDDAQARKYWLTCFEEALDGVRPALRPRAAGGRRGGGAGGPLWTPHGFCRRPRASRPPGQRRDSNRKTWV